MNVKFSDQRIDVPCPHCRHKISERLAVLAKQRDLTCPSCRGVINLDNAGMAAEIAKADKALADLQRTLSRLGK